LIEFDHGSDTVTNIEFPANFVALDFDALLWTGRALQHDWQEWRRDQLLNH
jgi:hypothetical protein